MLDPNGRGEVSLDVDELYVRYDELVSENVAPTEALQQALCDSIEEG